VGLPNVTFQGSFGCCRTCFSAAETSKFQSERTVTSEPVVVFALDALSKTTALKQQCCKKRITLMQK